MPTPDELTLIRAQVKIVGPGETKHFMYASRPKTLELLDEVERLQQENVWLAGLVEKMKALLKLGLKADGMRWAAEKSGDARADYLYKFLQARFAKGTAELLDGLEATVND